MSAPQPLRLLHVEDDRVSALLFSEALRGMPGLDLRLCESPEEALALTAAWTPDVLVLDAHLPGMSGHALLQALRARPALRRAHAVMCSADDSAAATANALAAGFDSCWPKPVPVDELQRRVRALALGLACAPADAPGTGPAPRTATGGGPR